ncbi:AraC-like DNA-binding protein [Paraburkholderia silvatlantica]|uniref:AraC-like DNA-binding protein n=1 Tax=Paraburkholderia silvatlantica TaxID=321895 RepID=A0A2V4TNY6_9BURK|nr:AraC-like DNA-binding protein [Paraburkholderia silvatlantica]
MALLVQGAKRTEIGDTTFEFRAGQILVIPANLPVISQVTAASTSVPYLAMAVELEPALIAELLSGGSVTLSERDETSGPAPREADDALLDALNRLLALIDSPEDVDVLLPMLKREIGWRLLRGEQGWMTGLIGRMDVQSSQVGAVLRWMREHYAEPISVGDLAAMTGMSVSTFYRRFRAITAASPLQYQKQIRLLQARMLLLGGNTDAVTAAYQVGYQSQSQFSREYRRLFGVAPMRDVSRNRSLRTARFDIV